MRFYFKIYADGKGPTYGYTPENRDLFGRPTGYRLMQNAECRMQNDGGDPSTLQLFNPSTVTYSYDSLGRFCGVGFNAEAQSGRVEYGYLPGTDLVSDKSVMVGEGNSAFCILHSALSHEPHRDLIAAVTNTFTPAGETYHLPLSTYHYSNDAAGRRVSRLDSFDGETTANTFSYNARSEVVSAIMDTNTYGYAYDPIGNRIESSQNAVTNLYVANSLNQYTSISNLCASVPLCEPTYDADGNMTADERGWRYVWNGENRMVCASNAEVVVTYAYDHRGRMGTKTFCASAPLRLIKTSTYIWDGWNIIREIVREGDSVAVTDNVWGLDLDGAMQGAGGVGGLLAVIRSNSSTPQLFLPTYDANGNISEYVSTNGEAAAHYDYSPFGEPLVASGPLAASFTHQFSTKPYCPVTGFSEYQMRKYRAAIGRWLSRDPIGEKMGPNLLQFCLNYATTLIDEFGFLPMPPSMPPPKAPPNCIVRYVKDREICFCTEPGTGNAYRRDCGFKCPPGMFPGSASVGHWIFVCSPPSPVNPSPPIPDVPKPPPQNPPTPPSPPTNPSPPPAIPPKRPSPPMQPPKDKDCCRQTDKSHLQDLLLSAGSCLPKIGNLIGIANSLSSGCPNAVRACQSWANDPQSWGGCMECCSSILSAFPNSIVLPHLCIKLCDPLFPGY